MTEFIVPSLLILVGFAGLVGGGELLVRGACAIAAAARVSPLVIGLTVVAFGTSAPELAVNLQSAYEGKTALAVGNAVGSNIFNVLVVVGLTALVTPPLMVSRRIIRLDVPIMIGASLLLVFLSQDGLLNRADGAIMFGLLVAYVLWSIARSRKEDGIDQEEYQPGRLIVEVLTFIAGLVLLALGSDWLVSGGSTIARLFGVSELVIGLTIVAVGTSLPEVVTSIVASAKGERDIAVGNVVGSNLFNILCVLGLGSICAPQGIDVGPQALTIDLPVMILVAIACLPIFFVGRRVTRWEGAILFGYYPIYLAYLVMRETDHAALGPISSFLLRILLPLTGIVLLINVIRNWRSPPPHASPEVQPPPS